MTTTSVPTATVRLVDDLRANIEQALASDPHLDTFGVGSVSFEVGSTRTSARQVTVVAATLRGTGEPVTGRRLARVRDAFADYTEDPRRRRVLADLIARVVESLLGSAPSLDAHVVSVDLTATHAHLD